jgi:tetrathionate reductase subunit C
MDMDVLYNVPHEFALSSVISTYFFLLGVGGGCSLLSIWATLTGKTDYKPLAKLGAVAVVALFSFAPTLLIIDLGQPLRFWFLMVRGNATSPLTWGSFFLSAYPLFASLYIIFLFLGKTKIYKPLAAALLPIAIGYVTYIGFIVSMAISASAWNTPLMPAFFASAAMVSAISLMTMVGITRYWIMSRFWDAGTKEAQFNIIIKLTRFASLFLLLNLFFIFTQQVYMRFSSEWAALAAQLLLEGKIGMNFGLFTLLLGTIIPLLVVALPKVNRQLPLLFVIMLFAEVGIFVMRYSITVGTQYLPIM